MFQGVTGVARDIANTDFESLANDISSDFSTASLEDLSEIYTKYIPTSLIPADIRSYIQEGSSIMSALGLSKEGQFNKFLYGFNNVSGIVETIGSIAGKLPGRKPASFFDNWTTNQQNFWEVRFVDPKSAGQGKMLPKYFAVLPAIDCSLSMGKSEVSEIIAHNKKFYIPAQGSGGSSFSVTFLDDETLSIHKFLRSWIKSTEPRPGVMLPLSHCALDIEFRKYTRTGRMIYERKLAVVPDGELTLELSAVSDEDTHTPFSFIIIGEES
ncbi:hypothetical protein [Vibrio phage Va2]|nr:hypothetical protein [Vibrio phage Va2]